MREFLGFLEKNLRLTKIPTAEHLKGVMSQAKRVVVLTRIGFSYSE
jgi:hypothetical protein